MKARIRISLEIRVGLDQRKQVIARELDHFPGGANPGPNDAPAAGQQVDIANELAGTVDHDQLLAAAARADDLDLAADHGEEAIGQVSLIEQDLSDSRSADLTLLTEAGQLGFGETRKQPLSSFGAVRLRVRSRVGHVCFRDYLIPCGGSYARRIAHINAITNVKQPDELQCDACVRIGARWQHLRTCQTCGVTLSATPLPTSTPRSTRPRAIIR